MDFAIEKITFSHYSTLEKGETFKNYSNARGVCGVVLAVSGKATYSFKGGSVRTLKQGEIALLSKESAYVLANTFGEDFVHYTINFKLCNKNKLFTDAGFFKPTNTEFYTKLFEDVINHSKGGNNLRAFSALYTLLADIFENFPKQAYDKGSYQSIKPAIDYITSEYEKDITLDILAQKCMMSNTNFRRVFKSVYGVSPIEYLIKIRLGRAKQLLLHTTLTVGEIANICGFNEVSYFSRIFKKRYSKTPLEYRNKN